MLDVLKAPTPADRQQCKQDYSYVGLAQARPNKNVYYTQYFCYVLHALKAHVQWNLCNKDTPK